MEKATYAVMLSSTYRELTEHRKTIRDAMLGQRLLPIAMEDDAALPAQDLIDASLAKVDESDAFVGLIGYRYGQIPECPTRNPNRLSLAELELRRAIDRGIPVCMLIMHDDHPIPKGWIRQDQGSEQQFEAFVQLAKKNRIYAEFNSVADLKAKAIQSLVTLRETLDARKPVNASILGNQANEPARDHGVTTGADIGEPERARSEAADRSDRERDTRTVSARRSKNWSHIPFAVAFFGLSALCAWTLSFLVVERDVSWVALTIFTLALVFFFVVGVLTLQRGAQQGS